MSFEAETRRYRLMAEGALGKYMDACPAPGGLKAAMAYSLKAGGKRLRPCMALAACEMLGGSAERALPYACALEMIHTYSLIHDDLPCMDDDDFRRGRPSNHRVFGEAAAVLAGDGLLSAALGIALEAAQEGPLPDSLNAARAVALGAENMVSGQFADTSPETEFSEDALRFIQSNKTAAMIKAALLAGAHMAGADGGERDALSRFAEAYGALFQMTDDILDVEGSFEFMGKTPGKDKDENKLTYPALMGIEAARAKAEEACGEALAALKAFGGKAAYFEELTRRTLHRRS